MLHLPLLCGRPDVLQGGYSFELLQGYALPCPRWLTLGCKCTLNLWLQNVVQIFPKLVTLSRARHASWQCELHFFDLTKGAKSYGYKNETSNDLPIIWPERKAWKGFVARRSVGELDAISKEVNCAKQTKMSLTQKLPTAGFVLRRQCLTNMLPKPSCCKNHVKSVILTTSEVKKHLKIAVNCFAWILDPYQLYCYSKKNDSKNI